MIHAGRYLSGLPREAILAHFIMTSDGENDSEGMTGEWDRSSGAPAVFFKPEELDIYTNKTAGEVYIFHGKTVDYDSIDRLEYDHDTYAVDVVLRGGMKIDLGVKIQWLIRPYFGQAREVSIVQTKDGEAVNGKIVPLIHKGKNLTTNAN